MVMEYFEIRDDYYPCAYASRQTLTTSTLRIRTFSVSINNHNAVLWCIILSASVALTLCIQTLRRFKRLSRDALQGTMRTLGTLRTDNTILRDMHEYSGATHSSKRQTRH